MNVLFIGLNIGIGTVIQDYISKIAENCILVGAFSLIGIVINLAWYGTFRRNNKYYHFRMAQAREVEPEGWRLLSDRGYRFSKGHEIPIPGKDLESKDQRHKLGFYEKFASNKKAIEIAIWIFIVGFGLLTFLSGKAFVQNNCNCKASVQAVKL